MRELRSRPSKKRRWEHAKRCVVNVLCLLRAGRVTRMKLRRRACHIGSLQVSRGRSREVGCKDKEKLSWGCNGREQFFGVDASNVWRLERRLKVRKIGEKTLCENHCGFYSSILHAWKKSWSKIFHHEIFCLGNKYSTSTKFENANQFFSLSIRCVCSLSDKICGQNNLRSGVGGSMNLFRMWRIYLDLEEEEILFFLLSGSWVSKFLNC